MSGTGIAEYLIGCNLKQADQKSIFLFLALNENPNENEIPFSAEKRKRRLPVPISQNLRFNCEHNIFGPTQMRSLERKCKMKRK